ncbi:TPA: hypothetical protein DDW35_07220, partial [Candidatus Sumerlaeota bacterium]|nr:hypothetical protein [Candidatus Sumerlaeota bacterium]
MPSLLRLILPLLFLVLAAPALSDAPTSDTQPLSHDEIQRFIPSFVQIKYHFKRSEEKAQGMGEWSSFNAESAARYAPFLEQKRALYAGGIAIAPDQVMTFDALLQDEYLDYIEIDNLRGGISRATRQSLLLDSPGMILKADEPAKLALQPLAFAEPAASVSPENTFYGLSFREENGKALFASTLSKPASIVTSTGDKMTWLPGGSRLPVLSRVGPLPNAADCPVLLLNSDKQPVGIGLPENALNATPGQPPLWYGKDLLAGHSLSFVQLDEIQKKAERDFDAVITEVKITFRQRSEDKYGTYFDFPDASTDAPQEVYFYGLPVSEKTLFIPKRLSRNLAKIIDRITVSVNGHDVSGKFVGAFNDVGAFLIELDKPVLKPASDLMQKGALPTVVPLLTIHAERKYGRKSIQAHYDRVLHSER